MTKKQKMKLTQYLQLAMLLNTAFFSFCSAAWVSFDLTSKIYKHTVRAGLQIPEMVKLEISPHTSQW